MLLKTNVNQGVVSWDEASQQQHRYFLSCAINVITQILTFFSRDQAVVHTTATSPTNSLQKVENVFRGTKLPSAIIPLKYTAFSIAHSALTKPVLS